MCIQENRISEKKIYQSCKFKKGQVWFVREPSELSDVKIAIKSHLMAKSRPYVIYGNVDETQNIVQGFPCTSNLRISSWSSLDYVKSLGDDLFFRTPNGISRIMTNQLVSIDTKFIDCYMCTLPDDLIIECDKIIFRMLGLDSSIMNISRDIDCVQAKLDGLKASAGETFVNIANPSNKMSISRTKSGRIRWNNELFHLFIEHCTTMSPNELCRIWGIEEGRIAQYRSYCLTKLKSTY